MPDDITYRACRASHTTTGRVYKPSAPLRRNRHGQLTMLTAEQEEEHERRIAAIAARVARECPAGPVANQSARVTRGRERHGRYG